MGQKMNIAYARPKGASTPFVQGVFDGLTSLAKAILSVTNSAGVQHILANESGILRVVSVAQGVFLKMGVGVGKATTKGTGVFTISGDIVPGVHAQNTLTSNGTAPADGATVTIGSTVYTAKTTLTTPAVPYEVLIGNTADASEFLDNLKSAINATAGAGTTYATGTVAHPDVVATTNGNTTQVVVARTPGTEHNTIATTETSATLSWADATLGGGAGASTPGVDGETVTMGDITYMFVDVLSETNGATAIPYQVLFGATSASALDNLKLAVDKGSTEGTNYSTGTVAHPYVTATTNTDTAQTIESRQAGTVYNDFSLTDTVENGAWGATTLGDSLLAFDYYIPAGGVMDVAIPDGTEVISLIGDGGTATVVIVEY